MKISCKIISTLTPLQLRQMLALYVQTQWVEAADDGDFLPRAIAGSTAFAAAFDGETLIGCARAISDGVSDAYIQDVAVHPDYRRKGIGRELIRLLTETLQSRGIDWIALVGAPGTEHFYQELGFTEQPGHTLWKWQK